MKHFDIKAGCTKKEFEAATGLKVAYRDKVKSGISFKLQGGLTYNRNKEVMERNAAWMQAQFPTCKVNVSSVKPPYFGKTYVMRIIVPHAA